MARVAPVRVSRSTTSTGNVCRLTIPKVVIEDEAFPLDLGKQVYMRIVPDGLLITHKSNGDAKCT